MIVWTFQPASILEEIERTGTFRCDPDRSFNLTKENNLKGQYAWLMDQMEKRIGPRPEGVTYPVWAWHTWDFGRRCPDPDSGAFLESREPKAALTLDLPEEGVVLTDFDAWQLVMNGNYVSDVIGTEEAFEKMLSWLEALSEEDLRKETERSWQRVFNTEPYDSDSFSRGRYVQATFWEIRREYIRDIRYL